MRSGVPRRFIVAQIRFGNSVGWHEADAASLAVSLNALSAAFDLPILFVPCMTGDGLDDRYAASRVREFLDSPSWAVIFELDARTTKAIIGLGELASGRGKSLLRLWSELRYAGRRDSRVSVHGAEARGSRRPMAAPRGCAAPKRRTSRRRSSKRLSG